jgi:hypothetical protein
MREPVGRDEQILFVIYLIDVANFSAMDELDAGN